MNEKLKNGLLAYLCGWIIVAIPAIICVIGGGYAPPELVSLFGGILSAILALIIGLETK